MKVKVVRKPYASSNFLFGIFILMLLFLILWGLKILTEPKHIDGRIINDAYGLEVMDRTLPDDSPLRTGEQRLIKYIVIHETGNPSSTANADAHNHYLESGGDGSTAWHYTVDDKLAYHHIPDDEIAYHAGRGNKYGIGIELCVNEGGDFEKTFDNGARLTAKLIDTYGLSVKSVKQHADFMEKNCPEHIRNDERWNEFLSLVKKYLKEN